MSPNKCVECSTFLVSGRCNEERLIAGVLFRLLLPALLCPDCHESYLDDATLYQAELLVSRELVRLGVRNSQSMLYIRKSLGLSRNALARAFGMTVETVYRWETMTAPEARAFVLLGHLVEDALAGTTTTMDLLDAAVRPSMTVGAAQEPCVIDLVAAKG